MPMEQKILKSVRDRCRDKGNPMEIDLSDIIIPERCPIFDIPLIGHGKVTDNTPTLDRINNDLGYIKSNVRVISRKANSMKGAMTIEICEKFMKYMKGEL